jgi:hypothetical protein
LHAHRLGQVAAKSGVVAGGDILFHAVAGQRDAPQTVVADPQFLHQVEAIAVRQADIRDQQLKLLLGGQRTRFGDRGGGFDPIAATRQQAGQGYASWLVILHQED